MAKTGRPRKQIDKKQFENLCGLQCTETEIAYVFDCSPDTIERFCKREYGMSFAEIFKIKRSRGNISLRKYQFELAKKNASMAIWLGKQYLGQADEFAGSQNLKEDEKDPLSIAFEEFTDNGKTAEDVG